MSIISILILVVVVISIVWAFKTGYVKALSEGYVFSFTTGTAEDGSSVPVLRLERGWRDRKFVGASPISGNTPGIFDKRVSHFLSDNREGYGQRLVPLMEAVQQRKQATVWVYPLDSQWAWDDSLNHRKSQDKD